MNVGTLHWVDEELRGVSRKLLRRSDVINFFANRENEGGRPEDCGSASYRLVSAISGNGSRSLVEH